MNWRIDRKAQEILKMTEYMGYYRSLPEHRKTVAVSLAAVSLRGQDLEHLSKKYFVFISLLTLLTYL